MIFLQSVMPEWVRYALMASIFCTITLNGFAQTFPYSFVPDPYPLVDGDTIDIDIYVGTESNQATITPSGVSLMYTPSGFSFSPNQTLSFLGLSGTDERGWIYDLPDVNYSGYTDSTGKNLIVYIDGDQSYTGYGFALRVCCVIIDIEDLNLRKSSLDLMGLSSFVSFSDPTSGKILIKSRDNQLPFNQISLWDLQGNLIYQTNISGNTSAISVGHLSSGVYLVKTNVAKLGAMKLIVTN